MKRTDGSLDRKLLTYVNSSGADEFQALIGSELRSHCVPSNLYTAPAIHESTFYTFISPRLHVFTLLACSALPQQVDRHSSMDTTSDRHIDAGNPL